MKFRWDKKYLYWGCTAFAVIAAAITFYFLVFQMDTFIRGIRRVIGVLNPIIYAGIIAYLLNPLVDWLEGLIYRFFSWRQWRIERRGRSVIRIIVVVLSLVLAALAIYGLLAMLIPEVLNSIVNIAENFPRYVDNVYVALEKYFFTNDSELNETTLNLLTRVSTEAENWISTSVLPQVQEVLKNLSSGVYDILKFLANVLIGVLVSVYILTSKETFAARGKRILYSIFSVPVGNKVLHNIRFIDNKFGGFFIGKIIDSVIIGMLCYIFSSLFRFPYALLISVIVGVTNIIPFFGPYLGAIPSAFLIFVVSPIQCLYFIIFILILQQIDGNIIGPKILSGSTGLSSFMVVVAILVGGGFFGIVGMFIAVPICAVIVAICQAWMDQRVEKKGLPDTLVPYRDMEYIDPDTMEPIPMKKRSRKENDSLYKSIKFTLKEAQDAVVPEDEKEEEAEAEQVEKEKEEQEEKENPDDTFE